MDVCERKPKLKNIYKVSPYMEKPITGIGLKYTESVENFVTLLVWRSFIEGLQYLNGLKYCYVDLEQEVQMNQTTF